MSASEDEAAETTLHLPPVLPRERQNLRDVVELAQGHLHSLGEGLQLPGLPGEQDLLKSPHNLLPSFK